MSSVFTGPGYRWSFRLIDLVGREFVANRTSSDHPLAHGLAAAEKSLLQDKPSEHERDLANSVELVARELFALESDWKPYERILRADLRKKERYLAIRFELRVCTFSLRQGCGEVKWTRYQNDRGDFLTSAPKLHVECKLVRAQRGSSSRSSDVRRQILDQIAQANKQEKSVGIPYVVAVGFDEEFARAEVDAVVAAMQDSRRWFEGHPEVSSVMIFTPQMYVREQLSEFGLRGQLREFGTVTEVRNLRAVNPLAHDINLKPQGLLSKRILDQIRKI